MTDDTNWRQQARTLQGSIYLLTFVLVVALKYRAEAVAEVLVTTHPLVIAGGLWITIAASMVLIEAAIVTVSNWRADPARDDLTEVPWDE